jgi:hypothetical protein
VSALGAASLRGAPAWCPPPGLTGPQWLCLPAAGGPGGAGTDQPQFEWLQNTLQAAHEVRCVLVLSQFVLGGGVKESVGVGPGGLGGGG